MPEPTETPEITPEPVVVVWYNETFGEAVCNYLGVEVFYEDNFKNILELNLTECGIIFIEDVARFTNLKKLVLEWNEIEDISALSALEKLEYLDLSHNNIKDISALSGLLSLKELYLRDNCIENADIISNLVELNTLDISYNYINEDGFSFVNSLEKLIYLNTENYY